MKKIAEGNHDKAWNDPPLFSYQTAASPRRRTALNKRVPFPLSTATPSTHLTPPVTSCSTMRTPPPMSASGPAPPVVMVPAVPALQSLPSGGSAPPSAPSSTDNHPCSTTGSRDDVEHPPSYSGSSSKTEVASHITPSVAAVTQPPSSSQEHQSDLGHRLMALLEDHTSTLTSPAREEVRQRVQIVSHLIDSDQLSADVLADLHKVVLALETGKWQVADEAMRALSVDHATSVGAGWMSALRQIVFHARPRGGATVP